MSETEQEPLIRRDRDTSELDLTDRDPKQICKDVVKVSFEDVIAEPAGMHSPDGVWKCSYHAFTKSKYYCYCILATTMGILLSLLWGLLLAVMSFCSIWAVGPCMRIWSVCLCQPYLLAMGKILSGVRGIFRKKV